MSNDVTEVDQTSPTTTHASAGNLPRPAMARIDLVPADESKAIADFYADPGFVDVASTAAGRYIFFLKLLLFIPAAIFTLYMGFVASDIYVSEVKFIVRSAAHSGEVGGLAALAQSQGMGRAVDETFAVAEYLDSRDVASRLAAENGLRDIMARRELDVISRYPNFYSRNNEEQFFRTFKRMVDISVDSTTGITTLDVSAARASDARALANAMLSKAEHFVNELNTRAQKDLVQFSETLLADSNARLSDVEARLATYRNTEMLLDPEKEANQSMVILGKLTTEIAQLEASLAQQVAMTPESPSIAPLRERIKAYRGQMLKMQQSLAGGRASIADKLQKFEMLTLERELAAKQVTEASLQLEKARRDAQSQRVYLQTVVSADEPDHPQKPRRLLWIMVALVSAFVLYRMLKSLIETTMDHLA